MCTEEIWWYMEESAETPTTTGKMREEKGKKKTK